MARAKANEVLRNKAKPNAVDELTRGIATLRELSIQIDDLSRDGFPYREAVRARTELSFRETIRRLFGEKSPEYQTHKNHKLKVGTRAESAQSTALLKEFIAALEIQRADLLGLKPEEVIAMVATEPTRPSLAVVPPAIPPDSPTMPCGDIPAQPTAASVPLAPAPPAIASGTITPPTPALAPSSTALSIVTPSPSIPALETVPPAPHETPAPSPLHPSASAGSTSVEAMQDPWLSDAPLPIAPHMTTCDASAAPPVTSSPAAKASINTPIPSTTVPPLASTRNTVLQGTIPPVPHATLRPRPGPVVNTEFPASTQPTKDVTAPLKAPPAPLHESSRQVTPPLGATAADATPLPTQDSRTLPPLVQAFAPIGTSMPPAPQQEPTATSGITGASVPIQSSTPAAPAVLITEKTPEPKASAEDGTLEILRRVCARFHLVARQLRLRKEYRPTLEINDEYDLQDLFSALLRLQFDEVGTDEWTPAYTNGAPRTSYLLDWEKTVVVVKQTRSGLTTKDLAEQIAADTARYTARPNATSLVCFVYDPDGRVGNPRGLEAELSSTDGRRRIEVIVAPK